MEKINFTYKIEMNIYEIYKIYYPYNVTTAKSKRNSRT